ncbi:MAG: hypothetical protein AAB628_00115 [Patescibacteria group bacterium]
MTSILPTSENQERNLFHTTAFITVILVSLLLTATTALATYPATKYSPGETLNPACGPTDTNCGVEQITVATSTQNFGIGTTSPYAKLSVVGQIVGAYFTGTTTTTSTFGGSVGIGTLVPVAKLDVAGDLILSGTNTRYLNFNASNGTAGYGFRDNSGTLQFKNSGGSWVDIPITPAGTTVTVPQFSVHKNGVQQTVVTNTDTKLTFSTEVFDTNANFANSRFTPTVAGKYLLMANAFCEDATGWCLLRLYKNGAEVAASGVATAGGKVQNVVAILDMNGSTDYVEAYVYNGGGTNIGGSSQETYFSGTLITGTASTPGGSTGALQFNSGGALGGASAYWDTNNSRLGIGTSTPYAKLSVWGSGTGTNQLINFSNSASTTLFTVLENGNVGIGTVFAI